MTTQAVPSSFGKISAASWVALACTALSLGGWVLAVNLMPSATPQAAAAPSVQDGGTAALVSFARHEATWVTVRSQAESRVKGWTLKTQEAVLVVYPRRDFNPAFTPSGTVQVAWLDGEKVVGLSDAGGAQHLSPPQEVTAAVLLPGDQAGRIQAGDRLNLVAARP